MNDFLQVYSYRSTNNYKTKKNINIIIDEQILFIQCFWSKSVRQ